MGFIVLFWMSGVAAFATDQIPDVDMHAITREVMTLQRYMFSEPDYGAAKNEASIRQSFPVLEAHLARLQTKVFTEEPALRANTSMLADQIQEADKAFQRGDKSYSRYMLLSSLQLCAACHTRTSSADFSLPESDLKGASLLDRANYLFATRQFDGGRKLFLEFLTNAGKSESPGLIRSASLALAIYYARVKADPAGGEELFSKLAKGKNFSAEQRRKFLDWSAAFAAWAKEHDQSEFVSDTQNMQQARKLLKQKTTPSGEEIRNLRVSSLLQAVLEARGEVSPLKAEALLALGKIYENLNFPLYFRFGDMYLKACIDDYRKSKAAQECFRALESSVKARVSQGSTGHDADIEEAELSKWKKLAY